MPERDEEPEMVLGRTSMFYVGGIDLDNELERLKFDNAKLKRRIAVLEEERRNQSWKDEYMYETYIRPNWKADGDW